MAAAALIFGCQDRERGESREENVSDLQQRSESALDRAKQAQERASSEQKDVQEAREEITEKRADVEGAQQELESAEARAAREAQEAQAAQQQAAGETQSAQQEASTAQQSAQELQQQQAAQTGQQQAEPQAGVGGSGTEPSASETRPFTGDQANLSGKVESAGEGSLVLLQPDGQRTTLAVNPQTEVIIDGQAASLEQIQEGSQIRASFDPSSGQNEPGRIEIQTEQTGSQPMQPAQQPTQQQQPAPQQQPTQQY